MWRADSFWIVLSEITEFYMDRPPQRWRLVGSPD